MNWIMLLLCFLSSAHAFKINRHLSDVLLDDGDMNEGILDSKDDDTKGNYGDNYRDNDGEDEDEADNENDDNGDDGDNDDGDYGDNDDGDDGDNDDGDDGDYGDNDDGDDGEIDGSDDSKNDVSDGGERGIKKKDAVKNTKRGLMFASGATRRVHTECCPVIIATKKTKMQLNCHFVCERQRNPPHCGLKVKRICEHTTIRIIQKSVCKPRRVYKTIQFLLPSTIQ
ncbi:S-antigen protein-like [Hydractinia symbiolongicarpus]|uniref:S-antigen protein-like n=1 Tax=Hydractinia symbiolongicarpus TaxID=13093 RepID=UPI00255006EB|nr:S-antigen protein-like [Hydractinia symbiolongicarpus]